MIVAHDRGLIVARSRFDRGTIAMQSWPDHLAIGADSAPNREPPRRQVKGHDRRAIVAINPLPRPHQTA